MVMWHLIGDDHVFSVVSLPVQSISRQEFDRQYPPHSHHALQLTVSLDQPFEVTVDPHAGRPGTFMPRAEAVLIGPDVHHQLYGYGVCLLCDPESPTGRRLLGVLRAENASALQLDAAPLKSIVDLVHARNTPDLKERHRAAYAAAMSVAAGHPEAPPLDPRIASVLDHVLGPDGHARPLQALARMAHLSKDRFRHLFVQEVGLPLRKYALWRRTVEATRSMALSSGQGYSLSSIAYDVGFADQAALTRSYRKQFGRTPSHFAREPNSLGSEG